MATFHRMTDEQGKDVVRCFVKGAPDQLLARAPTSVGGDLSDDRRSTTTAGERYLAENQRLGEQGLRVLATARKDFDPATFDPAADLLPLIDGPHAARPRRHRRPAPAAGEGRHRHGEGRRHPGPHDHRRPRRDGQGDRRPARHRGPGRHRRRVRGDGRRRAGRGDRRHRRHRPGHAAGQGPPGRHPQAQGPHRGHDRRRRERRAGAEEGRHRHRHGHHRHRGVEGGRGDDPHRRQLRHHRQGGRDRPRRSTTTSRSTSASRSACCSGFIVAFLGASILDIADGVPFVPLQTLFLNFTTDLFLAVGLGYGAAAAGLMQRQAPALRRGGAARGRCSSGWRSPASSWARPRSA